MLEKPTNKVLLSMSIPVSLGMLSTMLFQVVDTYFVGTLGAVPLTALSFASTVYFLLAGLFIGLATAISVLVGKFVGAKERQSVRITASVGLTIGFLAPLLLSLLGITLQNEIFTFLGADQEVMPHIAEYMTIMFAGFPILSMGIIAGSILRASGKVKLPEIVFGVAGIINAVLDYLFIFGKAGFPAIGIKGVALGTTISWVFILLVLLSALLKDKYLVWISSINTGVRSISKDIARFAGPSVLTQMIGPFTLIFITFLLGRQEAFAVAAYGVAGRIETLLMIGIMGVSTASTPFIAQNFGANKHLRIDEAIVFGGKAAFYLGVGLMVILLPFIKPIAGLFSNDEQIVGSTVFYFYIVGASYVFYSLYLVTAAIFNGLQMPGKSLRIMLVKTLAFTVPFAIAGSFFGVLGIFVGLSLSNVAGGLFARHEMIKDLRKVNSSLVGRSPFADIGKDIIWLLNRTKLITRD